MFPQNFFFEQADKDLSSWIDVFLGNEVFSPEEGRLERYFSTFKEQFTVLGIPIFIIAGTNGKGEVALGLEATLFENGWEPFVWMSPHILSVRERYSFSGKPIDGLKLLSLFKENEEKTTDLSYYEFLFYCFCQWVNDEAPKCKRPVIIFEVGLGGRLDATNFFDAQYSALVSIGRDHMDILGPTLQDVLREKMAVARPNRPLVSAVSQDVLRDELAKRCVERNIPMIQLDFSENASFKERNQGVVSELFKVFCQEQQVDYRPPLFSQKLWGRPFEVTYKSSQFILVGSHNLDGLRHLANWVNGLRNSKVCSEQSSDFDEVWIGMSRKVGPELDQCLQLVNLSPCLGKEVALFGFEHPRATSLNDLRESWHRIDQGRKVRFEKSWQKNLQALGESKKILVCGSYYFVGELLRDGPFFKK